MTPPPFPTVENTMTESNVSAERLADTLKRVQEILDYFDAEANEALAGETERGDLWSDIDIPVADLRTLIAAAKVRAIREGDGEWVELYGPYGWLNGCRGLSEDSWNLEMDPLENNEEYFAIPLYAKVDPFVAAVTDAPLSSHAGAPLSQRDLVDRVKDIVKSTLAATPIPATGDKG